MDHASRALTYRTRLLRHIDGSEWMTKALWVVGFAALTALLAQVRFYAPWNPYVPYTGQIAAVALSGLVLGAGLGMAAMTLYLAAGAVGLPVFADQSGGLEVLLGATGGYLFGFILASGVVGWLSRRWLDAPGERHLGRLGLYGLAGLGGAFGIGALILGYQNVLALQGVGLTVLVSSGAVAATALLLFLWSKGESQAFLARIACGLIAVLAVYVPGVLVLAVLTGMGWGPAIAYGALQFIPVDLAKIFVAAGVAGTVLPPVR